MRIQETNQILKEGKLHRLEHEQLERKRAATHSLRGRLTSIAGKVGQLVRRSDVQAGLSAAGVAIAATAGTLLRSRQKKRHSWFSFAK